MLPAGWERMNRSIRNLMDAFVQHLASKRTQLRALYKSGSNADAWLRLEFSHFLDYLHYVNKFNSFSPSHNDEGADILIRGEKCNTRLELGYFTTRWDLEPHLDEIQERVRRLAAKNEKDLRLLVEIMTSHGKWANKAMEDCVLRIQDATGVHFERYSPSLVLTLYNEYGDPLEENTILKLYFAYVKSV
jgi:hypothetical protein